MSGITVSRPFEEFRADFALIGRRALRDDGSASLLRLFNMAFVAGCDQQSCERRLSLFRGAFEIQTTAIKSIVGRAFIVTEPYALFPTNQYAREPENQPTIDFSAMKRGPHVPSDQRESGGWS